MKGDIDDVKTALAAVLSGPKFIAALAAAVVEKAAGVAPSPQAAVFTEERLTQNSFPACQLVAIRTTYPDQDMIKYGLHEIAVYWTAVATDEGTVTKHIQLLLRATVDLLWGVSLDMAVANGPIQVLEEDYSPLVPARDVPFLKSGRVILNVPVWRS